MVKSVFFRLPESAMAVSNPILGDSRRCRRGFAGRSVVKIKSQMRQLRAGDRRLSGNEQVRKEIDSFMRAMHSYPDRFARDPRVTFEEHHGRLVRAAMEESRSRA